MKPFLLLAVFVCTLYLPAKANQVTIFSDSSKHRQIDSILKKERYKKVKSVKVDEHIQKEIFWGGKHDKESFAVGVNESNVNKTLTMYYFIMGTLAKVSYLSNKPDHTSGGGVYYFSEGTLIYKREINIEPQNENHFITAAGPLKLKMAEYLQQ